MAQLGHCTTDTLVKRLIIRLISTHNYKSEPSTGFSACSKTNIWLKTKLFSQKLFAILLAISPLFINSGVANAGFFSTVISFFEGQPTSEVVFSTQNSQKMPLLEAGLRPDPTAGRGGGDITVVNSSSLLSENGPSGTTADIEESTPSTQISIYTVRNGDTLSGIAKMFGVSVNTIRWANTIGSTVTEGQRLVILPISGVTHIVKAGDTIKKIAAKYKADAGEIVQFNNLKPDAQLAVGDEIIVPDAVISLTPIGANGKPLRGAGGPNYVGYYIRPIPHAPKTQGLHGYNGIDLGAPEGTAVLAAASGEVIISRNYGWNGGYGQYIVIQHDNGTQTLYGHLSEIIVYEGYRVVQGQVIGLSGNTGKSTGPHLHFEVRGARNPF
jgi:LysM repeat protein